ncbi:phosphate regulon transcriptional regulator PhoB [Igneacidithiobacillus siniensis]|jgi:two-component system phosphate regulon response regulator PhoB|uniref:phosphate regulon transcriptional regulator PhoB n=1 Tax=Acidithiobacillus TaxID=119977 RepID=UPI00200EF2BC|nr:phosphate regulon transcriptional regulator PhoB [Acidithiobacillus sp. S30A2]
MAEEASEQQIFRILVVEDEEGIQELLRLSLQKHGFEVVCAASTEAAEDLLHDPAPHLIVLDWMLPGESGIAWCRNLRRRDSLQSIPIILLTARGEEGDRVHGLESGADDYLTKPFSPRELVARVQALLRRSYGGLTPNRIRIGALNIDIKAHRVTLQDQLVAMGPTEFRLLRLFVTNPDRVYSREALLDIIWGRQTYVEERTVDVHIRRLRRCLEKVGYAHIIETVRGEGYRCNPLPQQSEVVSEAP